MKSILNILSIILISHPTFSQESSFCSYSTDTTQGVPIATNHPLYIYVKHKVDSIVKSTHREYVGILGIKFTIDSTRSIDSVTRIKFVHPNLDSVFFEALINAESELFNQLKYSKL